MLGVPQTRPGLPTAQHQASCRERLCHRHRTQSPRPLPAPHKAHTPPVREQGLLAAFHDQLQPCPPGLAPHCWPPAPLLWEPQHPQEPLRTLRRAGGQGSVPWLPQRQAPPSPPSRTSSRQDTAAPPASAPCACRGVRGRSRDPRRTVPPSLAAAVTACHRGGRRGRDVCHCPTPRSSSPGRQEHRQRGLPQPLQAPADKFLSVAAAARGTRAPGEHGSLRVGAATN